MRVESYDKQMNRTCRRCFTVLDRRKDYCCVKSRTKCFADLGLVKKALMQDKSVTRRLYKAGKIDFEGKIIDGRFFTGWLKNQCLVFEYRPPGCRSHFCDKWNRYIKEKPTDFVYANLSVVSMATLLKEMRKQFEYGIKMSYPGGFIIYTSKPKKVKKALYKLFDEMQLPYFSSDVEMMDPEKNKRKGIEVIMDTKAFIERPGLFGTLIENNMFMLVRMKMNMGSTGRPHCNIMITSADPLKVAKESPASLKSFHALIAYAV